MQPWLRGSSTGTRQGRPGEVSVSSIFHLGVIHVRAMESLPEPSGMHVNDALVDVNAYVTKQEAGKGMQHQLNPGRSVSLFAVDYTE